VGVPDDFSMWEEEVSDPAEPNGDKAILFTGLMIMAASGVLITFGLPFLGIASLVVLALLLFLWHTGY
jgi:hypothetical protein